MKKKAKEQQSLSVNVNGTRQGNQRSLKAETNQPFRIELLTQQQNLLNQVAHLSDRWTFRLCITPFVPT